ncbi:MAG TPA: J domain-containing protein [Polyangia bacterium]
MERRRNHYEVLGIDKTATAVEIKAAYRKLALVYHPDRNPGDGAAEERFKELSYAYAVLGDADKRAHFDRFGGDVDGAFSMATDLNLATDFFNAIFGDLFGLGRKKAAGHDLRYTLELSFEEAALGCEKSIIFARQEDCDRCRGTGAEGGAAGLIRCDKCDGQGSIRQRAGFFAAKRECLACGGAGEIPRVRCSACTGTGLRERTREYNVRVPPGSTSGSTQRVAGEGSPGRRGGPAGDLFVNVRVRPHPFFREESLLLHCELPVSASEAALGADVEVLLLDQQVIMKIPPGTQSGAVFRLRGKGIPRGHSGTRGDAHVRVLIETPVALDEELRGLYGQLEAALKPDALPRRQAFRAQKPTPPVATTSSVSPRRQKASS